MSRRLRAVPRLTGIVCALLPFLALVPATSRAQTAAITFDPRGTRYDFRSLQNPNSWVMGYKFDTSTAVPVFGLGFYDSGSAPQSSPGFQPTITQPDGLATTHQVGIFDGETNALLVRATVDAGTTDDLLGYFRYTPKLYAPDGVTLLNGPYVLNTGTYYIEAVTNGENYTYLGDSTFILTDPRIGYLHSQYGVGNQLAFPASQDQAFGYFGPNFLTSPLPTPAGGGGALPTDPINGGNAAGLPPSGVPEPGNIACGLALGLSALGILRRKRA